MNEGGILLVEDELINRKLYKSILSELGVPVHCAADGAKCLEMVFAIKPDLILLDIRMPVMNGFDTLQELQRNPDSFSIPVLMVTSDSDFNSISKAFAMGASDYLQKPFTAEEMLARSHNLLRIRQLEKNIAADLSTAVALQKKFLTNESEAITALSNLGYQAAIFNKPSLTISGDFYYPVIIDSNSMGFFFADTCGHGLSAALISMRIIGMLSTLRYATHTPEFYLRIINEDLCSILPMERFVAASYSTFTATNMTIANAGQPYPLHITLNSIKEIQSKGYPIGQIPGRTFTNVTVQLNSGDKIIFYSDGLIEAMNQEEKCYGKERLVQALRQGIDQGLNSNGLIEYVISDVIEFCDTVPPDDDITLVIIEKKNFASEKTKTFANTQQAIGEFLENFRENILNRVFKNIRKKEQVEYVLMEALDNAWEHGNKKDASKKIIVEWTITLDYLTIFVKDEGEGFQYVIPNTMPSGTNSRGRGLFTINEFVDAISFNTKGNQITLHIFRGEEHHERHTDSPRTCLYS